METKMEMIRRMVRRRQGASVNELTDATGWTAHSLTGAISRIRTGGQAITRKQTPNRGVVYTASR